MKRKLREAAPPVPPEDDPMQGAANLLDEPPVEEGPEGPPTPDQDMPPGGPGEGGPPPVLDPAEGPPEAPAQEEPPIPGGEDKGASRTSAITGKYNSSPVGDIKMQKAKGTYNTYKLEMSMGQLEVIMNALENNHDDPVSDELLATFQYYLKELPGPGEDEEKFDAEKKAKAEREAGLGGEGGEIGTVPAPPGGAAGTAPAGAEEPASFMPDEEEEEEPAGMGAPVGGGEPGLPEPEPGAEEPPPGEPPGKSRMLATARGEEPDNLPLAMPPRE